VSNDVYQNIKFHPNSYRTFISRTQADRQANIQTQNKHADENVSSHVKVVGDINELSQLHHSEASFSENE